MQSAPIPAAGSNPILRYRRCGGIVSPGGGVDNASAFSGGTEGSNLPSSSGESVANRFLPRGEPNHFGSLPTAQTVRFDKPLDRGLTQPDRLCWCRYLAPQIEKPIGGEVVSELEHLRVVAPELLTHTAGQTSAFLLVE
jgi:hypothetical protein